MKKNSTLWGNPGSPKPPSWGFAWGLWRIEGFRMVWRAKRAIYSGLWWCGERSEPFIVDYFGFAISGSLRSP